MVLRIHNIGAWLTCKPGEAFKLSGDKRRPIRIDFNAEGPTCVKLVDSAGVVTFLASFVGLQTVEFMAGGEGAADGDGHRPDLIVSPDSESDVWYRTVDGDVEAYSSVAESFVKVATRRSRNPQLELMMFKQEQNMKRREALLTDQIAAMTARLDAAAEAARVAAEQAAPIVENEEVAANDNSAPASEGAAGEDATPPVAGSVSAKSARKAPAKSAAAGKGGDGANG